jgi:osmotically inducible lipoprotein OsmB
MKRVILTAPLILSLLALTACGTSTGERALSGGGIGAGVGAIGGALLGSPLEGALIGGAVGAGTGALTSSDQIYLGRPLWR